MVIAYCWTCLSSFDQPLPLTDVINPRVSLRAQTWSPVWHLHMGHDVRKVLCGGCRAIISDCQCATDRIESMFA